MNKQDLENMSVDELATMLIEDDLDTVQCGERDSVSSMLFEGFIGYKNQTKEQLVAECCERLAI